MTKEIINEIVDQYFELKINTPTRKRPYIEARAVYYKLCREFTNLTLENIGWDFDKNHATVLNGIRQLDNWMNHDSRIKNNYKILKNKIFNIEQEEEVIEINEGLVLRYATLKQQVKNLQEANQELCKQLQEITEKHNRREKFYQKYGFIG